ncbi:MAG: DNA-processing protein DprA [Minwuia sp.]|nr:DNA-processing protein DprA [Minwuia sp.]
MNMPAPMQPEEGPTALSEAERRARVRLIRSENIGPATFHGLLARYGSAVAALDALPEIAARAGKRKLRIAAAGTVDTEWRALQRLGGRFLIFGDPDFPASLAAVGSAPPVLATVGRIDLLHRPTLGVVGARNASANGRTLCQQIAREVGEAGVTIISGLARGIDAAAHQASLATGTVGVVAGGIDVFYPPENHDLQAAIGNQGLVVAEAPLGAEPLARHFPRRNRIISGLSLAVLVIEAQIRSGSLITARLAGEQGREVLAVPGSPLDPRARGANRLIRDGARLVESADDVLDEMRGLGAMARGTSSSASPRPLQEQQPDGGFRAMQAADEGDVDAARANLIDALSPEPAGADHLMRAAGLSAPVFHAAMLELEITGQVTRHAGNRFSLDLAQGASGPEHRDR